jgi:phosphoenolpyruvate carboxykinase (ATP)
LAKAEYQKFPIFNLNIPKHIPGIPDEILNPELAWSDSASFQSELKKLAGLFNKVRAPWAGD